MTAPTPPASPAVEEPFPIMQDHTAFPTISKVITDCVHHNGGTAGRNFAGIADPETDVIRLLDECLAADGVYHDDLKALDDWLAALSPYDLETVIDGEDTYVGAILASAPNIGDGTAREWIDQTYEHCI